MIKLIIESTLLIYSGVLLVFYTVLVFWAIRRLRAYTGSKEIADTFLLLNSPFQPSVSIVASCYNEALLIADCVGALMRLEYDNYQVIIVNDGSKDDTLKILTETYDLYLSDQQVPSTIPTAEVRGVYLSRNKTWYNLTVIDKANGGKADAMNAGLCYATNDYLICIDADSVLVPDALSKLMMPVLRASDSEPVVAVGGTIGIANGCIIDNGVVVSKRVPDNYLASIQVVEYARAFLVGRMGWSATNSLLLVSGALGMFKRELILGIGGYDKTTIGEDFELVVRIRRMLLEAKVKHRVEYIPETLLWTEVPSTFKILYRQRKRWAKGLLSTLFRNRKMLFNPRYGRFGMLIFPYWVFYEWLAPFVEFFGMLYFVYCIVASDVNWLFFAFLTIFMFLFGGVLSVAGVMFEQLVIHSYERKQDVLKLFLRGVTELLLFHPFVVYSSIKGNIEYMMGKRLGWGEMSRRGHSSDSRKR